MSVSADAKQRYFKNINYMALVGLCPFIYSVCNNSYNFHSKCILVFGLLFHTNCKNRFFKWLDIMVVTSNFLYMLYYCIFTNYVLGYTLYYYFTACMITITFVFNQWIFVTQYKNYVHVLLITWPGWYCINHFENIQKVLPK
jgi:hypothetical protein